MSTNLKILTYMSPGQINDGVSFQSIVSPASGYHLLVSQVKHGMGSYRIDETLVFRCDADGNVTNWCEMFSGRDTADAIVQIERHWTQQDHDQVD